MQQKKAGIWSQKFQIRVSTPVPARRQSNLVSISPLIKMGIERIKRENAILCRVIPVLVCTGFQFLLLLKRSSHSDQGRTLLGEVIESDPLVESHMVCLGNFSEVS